MLHSSIRPAELPGLLADLPPGVRYLSLDCFDTLLWRNVHKPTDIFAELPLPGNVELRVNAENAARHEALLLHARRDVTLEDIHAKLLPDNRADERQAMIEAELEAEARHCYIFAPVRDLIVAAKQRGLQVVIVSDTYLSEERLRALIDRAGGRDVLTMIDRIFCSCDVGLGKAAGLFKPVMKALGATPAQMLHIGDNPVSDQQAPAQLGINTVQLVAFDDKAEQRLRHEAAVMALLEPGTGVSHPPLQAHRAQIACRSDDDPLYTLGHDVLGPVLHAFAAWLRRETEALEEKAGKPVKLLFLMRDGYMPARAFAALYPELSDRIAIGEISRFTARAASFISQRAIQRYLVEMIPSTATGDYIAQQLLFDKDEQKRFASSRDRGDLASKIALPFNREKILKRSTAMALRLCDHLRAAGIADGDTVMIVDTGYNGSVQNMVDRTLREAMNLDLHGRYLLLCEHALSGLDKKGMFDLRQHSTQGLRALWQDISILEKICANGQGSVIDYQRDGTPIRAAIELSETQEQRREAIQTGALAYLAHVGQAMVSPPASADADGLARTAFAVLGRLIFLPGRDEVEAFTGFEQDINQGTGAKLDMLDTASANVGMRRRGLSYVKNANRVFQAAELRDQGLPLSLAMMAMSRFSLDVRQGDFEVGGTRLPIVLLDGGEPLITAVDAYPTTEGYYRAVVPIGPRRYAVGLRLGMIADIVQVEEAAFLPLGELIGRADEEFSVPAAPIVEAMEEIAPGLFRSQNRQGFMLVPPPPAQTSGRGVNGNWLLSFVFRPVVALNAAAITDSRQQAA